MRPVVVELVGPAGAGKSVLAERLRAPGGVVRASVWNLPRLLLLESFVRSLPLLFRLCARDARVPLKVLKQIIRLNALHLLVRRTNHTGLVVLDEGPIFALSWLRVFGRPSVRPDVTLRWWHGTYARWAAVLDRAILLDASSAVLAERLRRRRKPDDVYQHRTDAQVLDLTARYRSAFRRVLDDFVTASGTPPLELVADRPMPELGDAVLASVELIRHG